MSEVSSIEMGDATWLERQRRRKTGLEMISLVVPIAAAIFFSGRLIAQWPVTRSTLWALLVALLTTAYWIWHRSRYPARVPTPMQPVADSWKAPRREMDEDAGSIWHPVNLLVVAIGAVAVLTVVVVGTLVSFLLPLTIVVVFAVGTAGSDLGGVGWATLWTLAVAAVAEFAVVLPLAKLWGLATDDVGPERSDFCAPTSI